nr:ribonuclease H-like domain, reverse transcriptase, RNA-dependent DNA polymerase [Tanacetum cinerariifolium]
MFRNLDDKTKKEAKGKSLVKSFTRYRDLSGEFKDCSNNSTNEVNDAGSIVHTVEKNSLNSTNTFSAVGPSNDVVSPTYGKSSFIDASQLPDDLDMPELEDITYSDDEDIVVARIEAIRLFLAYASFMGFMVYQMDVKSAFLYGTIKEEVYVCQPIVFEDPDYPDNVYKVVKPLYGLHQAPRACQDKYVDENLRKSGLTEGKSASTPVDIEKPLLKDPDGEDVDVHTYRSMIGSLIYLTSSRPDIMFADTDVTRLQALVDKKKVVVTKTAIKEYALTVKLNIYVSYIKQFWNTVAIKQDTDVTRAGKRFSGVKTPLFKGMIVGQVIEEGGAKEEHVKDDTEALDACAALSRRVEHLEYDKVAQALEITKLKSRVKKLEKEKKGRKIDKLDNDDVVALMDDKEEEKKEQKAKDGQKWKRAEHYRVSMRLQHKKAAKRRKLNEEVEDLKRHLEIVPNEDDDVYTEATLLARKVPVVHYEIIHLNNKPHYKIIRADGTHQLFLILLVERRYPLSRFTLDPMLNAVRLRVEEESEMSLELLRLTVRSILAACGVSLPSLNFPFCALDIEDMEHVLVKCQCVMMVL